VKTLVVDASVAVKWQLDDEEYVDRADAIKHAFLQRTVELAVPVIFSVEWANAINVAITRSRFPENEWQQALQDLEALQIPIRNPPGLLLEAWQIARLYRRAVYDTMYVALAKMEGCKMITGDKKLFNSVASHLDWVHWIGDFAIEQET
jgi:predicted nucleic acid-binding protein